MRGRRPLPPSNSLLTKSSTECLYTRYCVYTCTSPHSTLTTRVGPNIQLHLLSLHCEHCAWLDFLDLLSSFSYFHGDQAEDSDEDCGGHNCCDSHHDGQGVDVTSLCSVVCYDDTLEEGSTVVVTIIELVFIRADIRAKFATVLECITVRVFLWTLPLLTALCVWHTSAAHY